MSKGEMPQRPCFICDGTGLKCDICGESEAACDCPDEDLPLDGSSPTFSPCPDCKGTGIASADLDKKGA